MKDLGKIKQKLKEVLEKEEDILFVYLYGSVALGMGHQWSDLDIAVYLRPGNNEYYLKRDGELLGTLSVALENEELDLCLLNVAPLVLQFRVITEGIIIFSRDEQARVDFETVIRCKYFDLKPTINLQKLLFQEKLKTWALG